jgi:hypothetical protein
VTRPGAGGTLFLVLFGLLLLSCRDEA